MKRLMFLNRIKTAEWRLLLPPLLLLLLLLPLLVPLPLLPGEWWTRA